MGDIKIEIWGAPMLVSENIEKNPILREDDFWDEKVKMIACASCASTKYNLNVCQGSTYRKQLWVKGMNIYQDFTCTLLERYYEKWGT